MAPLRLAILEADIPIPGADKKYQGYRGVFRHLLDQAMGPDRPLPSVITLSGHDVVSDLDSYPPLDSIDAILISGSKHSAFESDPWILKLVKYTREALATNGRVKVVGVCFGHQIVGRALGLPVARSDKGWEVSVTETRLCEKGKELFPGREKLVCEPLYVYYYSFIMLSHLGFVFVMPLHNLHSLILRRFV